METTVCFTGHRHIPDEEYPALNEHLCQVIEELIGRGACVFRTGGALGFDTMAALAVLSLRLKYPHIRLELILPCPTQTRGWSKDDILLYEQILSRANSHRYMSQHYWNGVLQLRNRALIEGSDVCISYLKTSRGGGAAFTFALALRKGLETVNLADRL